MDHALTIAYFVFYAADYFLLSRSISGGDRTPGDVRRGGAHVFAAARSRLHDAGDSGVSDGAGLCRAHRGQRFSFLLCGIHADGGRHIHPDGNAPVRTSRTISSATLQRRARASAFGFLAGADDAGFGADDIGGGGAVFFLMPRMSVGYLGGYSFGTDFSTGFSDRVQLGRIGQIQQSNAVVMHIRLTGTRAGNTRCTGAAWRWPTFDGKNWSNPRQQYVLQRERVELRGAAVQPGTGSGLRGAAVRPRRELRAHLIHYRRAAGADRYERIFSRSLGTPGRGDRIEHCRWMRAEPFTISISSAPSVSTRRTRTSPGRRPRNFGRRAIAFPQFARPICNCLHSIRAFRLAAQIAGSASNGYDKASRSKLT
jgi:hypothetical protein